MMIQRVHEAYDAGGRRKYLTVGEGKAFLKSSKTLGKRERLFCETMFVAGCRISEAIALTREDIDVRESVILVRCLKKRGKVVTRRIPVPRKLARELRKLPGEDGRLWPMSRMTGWRLIKSVMENAEITGLHACPKGLRHGFGVRAALANVPLNIIQRWMGHASAQTTAIYLGVMDEEERKLMARTWL